MEPSNERQEATPKDAGADLDWNMLIEASFAIEAQVEAEGLAAPEKLAELGYDGLAEPTFRIIRSQLPDDYADSLVRKLSAEEIGKLLAEKADHPIIQFAIMEAAERIGPAGDQILMEMIEKSPPEFAIVVLTRFSQKIVDQEVAPEISIFLQRDGLSPDTLKYAFEILESLNKEAQAITREVVKKFQTHECPEIRDAARRVVKTTMSGLVKEVFEAGRKQKPGQNLSPREQMIVDMKKEWAAKFLKRRGTES